MRFSFIIIVLNGIPFIEAVLSSIYDRAHEIIIVEGAVENCKFAANPDGSSKDGTVEFIKAFFDPDNKISLIQGSWPEKCEMQNKAIEVATGDYIWLVDSDEVYKKEDIDTVNEMLEDDPTITQMNFPVFHFWKGFDYIISSEILEKDALGFSRIFKLEKPCHFTTHRPPTLLLEGRKKCTNNIHPIVSSGLKAKEVYLYHYSYVLVEQVKQKITLYKYYGWEKYWNINLDDWYNNCFLKWTPENKEVIEKDYPIWTGDRNSITRRFERSHPSSMSSIMAKIEGK